jgi:hypothetical protein
MTRILSIGEFGEFATITLEIVTAECADELREKKISWSDSEIIAFAEGKPIVGVIRVYPSTTPGARSRGSQVMLLSCSKDLRFNPKHVLRTARRRYRLG